MALSPSSFWQFFSSFSFPKFFKTFLSFPECPSFLMTFPSSRFFFSPAFSLCPFFSPSQPFFSSRAELTSRFPTNPPFRHPFFHLRFWTSSRDFLVFTLSIWTSFFRFALSPLRFLPRYPFIIFSEPIPPPGPLSREPSSDFLAPIPCRPFWNFP